MYDSIHKIVAEYQRSSIQSEAEVRSKLIVPLLDALGYDPTLRAEEFPVYGFEGGKRLPAKNADFILFSDKHFAEHREYTSACLDWVYQHSLFVVEAKKPGEMPDILGQPVYYTVWTRAVAYLAIDGIRVRGYFYSATGPDYQVIDCAVDDRHFEETIQAFSYENILALKEAGTTVHLSREREGYGAAGYVVPTEKDLDSIPESTLRYMRYALGKNAVGLNKLQLVSRFLNSTDSFLQNDLRYDIPKYMFDIPRHLYDARLYIDDVILPIGQGKITEFYWENYERLIFENENIQIMIILSDGQLCDFSIGFRALDRTVSDRLAAFERIERVLFAKSVRVSLEDSTRRSIRLPSGHPKTMWAEQDSVLGIFHFWKNGLVQLKEIETFYEIEFKLQFVSGEESLLNLYQAIDTVYAGIAMTKNCEVLLPGGIVDEDVDIKEPIVFEEEIRAPLKGVDIHGVHFAPHRSWLLPGRIPMRGTAEGDIVKADGCCSYRIAPI